MLAADNEEEVLSKKRACATKFKRHMLNLPDRVLDTRAIERFLTTYRKIGQERSTEAHDSNDGGGEDAAGSAVAAPPAPVASLFASAPTATGATAFSFGTANAPAPAPAFGGFSTTPAPSVAAAAAEAKPSEDADQSSGGGGASEKAEASSDSNIHVVYETNVKVMHYREKKRRVQAQGTLKLEQNKSTGKCRGVVVSCFLVVDVVVRLRQHFLY